MVTLAFWFTNRPPPAPRPPPPLPPPCPPCAATFWMMISEMLTAISGGTPLPVVASPETKKARCAPPSITMPGAPWIVMLE
jgi:hypothetical protein